MARASRKELRDAFRMGVERAFEFESACTGIYTGVSRDTLNKWAHEAYPDEYLKRYVSGYWYKYVDDKFWVQMITTGEWHILCDNVHEMDPDLLVFLANLKKETLDASNR